MSSTKEINRLIEEKLKAINKKNYKEVVLLCNYLGDIYSNKGDYEEAIEQHKDELSYGKRLNDKLSIAVAYRRLGECYSELSDFKNALEFQNEYLSLVKELNNKVEIQRAHATLGRTYFMQFSLDTKLNQNESLSKAEIEHQKALKLIGSIVNDELKERELAEMKCRAYLNLGLIYEQKDDEQKCKLYFQNAIKLAKRYAFKEDLNRCELSLAAFYSKIGQYSDANKIYNLAILSAKELKNKLTLFETLMGKASNLIQLEDYENAKHCFKKAYFIYKEDCDENCEAKRFLKLVKQIIIKLRELNSDESNVNRIKICDTLADAFVDLNCYSKALTYYNQELHYALDENYSKSQLSSIYLSLGQTYLDNKQFIEAISNFKKEIECNQGKLKEEVLTSLKIIEANYSFYRDENKSINEYDHLISLCANDCKLKRIVYKQYLDFLEEINDCDLYFDKIKQIKSILDSLSKKARRDEQFNSQSTNDADSQSTTTTNDERGEEENALSDVSNLTSDSETEENEELNERRTRRAAKKGLDGKRNEKGETPLHVACIEGNLKSVEKLINQGHKINIRDNCGWLPLHEASNHGHAEIVQLLISNGALVSDGNGRGCDGTTPLHDACTNGHLSVIRTLLKADANVSCIDHHNNTPLDCLNRYLERIKDSLTDFERKDYKLLVNEMVEKMKSKGFFEKKSLKRSFSLIDKLNYSTTTNQQQHYELDELSSRIDRNRLKRSKMLDSPPRKTNRLINQPATLNSNNLRKNIDHSLDQPNDISIKAQRIDSLIDEDNLIVDDWLEDDLGIVNNRKPKSINDPFTTKSNDQYKSPIKYKSSLSSKNNNQRTTNRNNLALIDEDSIDCQFDSDIEMQDNSNYLANNNERFEVLNEEEHSNSSDVQPVSTFTTSEFVNKKKVKRKQKKINSYFNLDGSIVKSRNDELSKKDDVILVNSNVNCAKNEIKTTQSKKINKLKVHVHIDGMILLVPLQNESASIGWLMNETIERYYSFKKIRPIVQLKTMDNALLSNDDQIVDVLTNMEVKVEIDSFNIKPIDELYNELCKIEKLKIINELDYEFRISMVSGCLNLRNCFLEDAQFNLLINSLKMQTKIRVLDLSYSNLVKLDFNFNLTQTIFNLNNLEVLNLESTGLGRQHLIEFCKAKTSKLASLNLNYNLLLNCDDLICDLIANNCNLTKLYIQYTDLSNQLLGNLNLHKLIEKRTNLQIHIDTLKSSKYFIGSSFVVSSLDVLEANEKDYQEFHKHLFKQLF